MHKYEYLHNIKKGRIDEKVRKSLGRDDDKVRVRVRKKVRKSVAFSNNENTLNVI